MKRNVMLNVMLMCVVLALVAGMATGCRSRGVIEPLTTDLSDAERFAPETTTGDGLPQMELERLLFEPGSQYGLQTVYFDYDSSALRPDTMAILRDNAEKIKRVPGVVIQVAGHCDERGTQEYNLALGERRALAVREYLIQMGVSGDRIITISYGKEFPAVLGSNEAAWAMNRRGEFHRAR